MVYAKVDETVADYGIGTEGLRIGKMVDSDTGESESEQYLVNKDGKVIKENDDEIIVGHQALAKKVGDAYYYYIYNAHGDVIMMVDESGNVKNTYEYDAWGKITEETETVPNSIKYAGEYYDAETGFIYLRNRMYDPATRRFTSEDPARDQLNWYAYCGNNPVMFIDPWGLAPTVREAAAMAEHIYKYNQWDSLYNRTIRIDGNDTGWRLIDVYWIGSMKMGVYIRGDEYSSYDGPIEYALVNMGTSSIGGWYENFNQPLGSSEDMKLSIAFAEGFVANHPENEITFIGHSKGGSEAIANAVATNKNCITFNTSFPNLWAYGLYTKEKNYSASMTHYIVTGDPVNKLEGAPGIGNTEYLPRAGIDWALVNHEMQTIIQRLKEEGYR